MTYYSQFDPAKWCNWLDQMEDDFIEKIESDSLVAAFLLTFFPPVFRVPYLECFVTFNRSVLHNLCSPTSWDETLDLRMQHLYLHFRLCVRVCSPSRFNFQHESWKNLLKKSLQNLLAHSQLLRCREKELHCRDGQKFCLLEPSCPKSRKRMLARAHIASFLMHAPGKWSLSWFMRDVNNAIYFVP